MFTLYRTIRNRFQPFDLKEFEVLRGSLATCQAEAEKLNANGFYTIIKVNVCVSV